MNTPGKDYTHHSWLAAAALIAVLVAVSFIPPQSVGGVKLRRANILSGFKPSTWSFIREIRGEITRVMPGNNSAGT